MNDDRPESRETKDDKSSPKDDSAAEMTDAPILVPSQLVSQTYRDVLSQVAEPIVDQIRTEVVAYHGPTGGRRHQLITMATNAALQTYLVTGPQQAAAQRKADELFRRMGWGEAQDGNGPEHLELALRAARRVIWQHLADHAAAHDLSVQSLRDVVDAILEQGDHLHGEFLVGHQLWQPDPRHEESQGVAGLWDLLRSGDAGRISPLRPLGVDLGALSEAAEQAQWPIPEQVVAIAVSYHADPPPIPASNEILAMLESDRLLALCPADLAEDFITELARSATDRRVAVSWPVPPEESGTALLWSLRALDLVQLGVIAPTQVVRCIDHSIHLWLHSEPSMRRHLCQGLLEPLLAESPNSRAILSETLLTWLETRDSAPAIAARLDVHPQTVRYRWRRINELFGEALHDPEFVVQITLVLKSSLPMWKAGDQRDFDLFKGTKETGL